METTAHWEAARQKRERKTAAQRQPNVFAGGLTTDAAEIAGVPVLRLSAWPKGASAPPYSYALKSVRGSAASDEEVFPDEDADFDDETNGDVERRGAPTSADKDEFEEETDIIWESVQNAKLPFNLEWQQAAESRWDFFFDLPRDSQCMALGERLSGLNLRSASHTLFNTDEPKHTESIDQMYKSIPFLIVRHQRKYHALFLDSPARQRWDLDSELSGWAHVELLSRRGWQLYCMGPSSLPDLLNAYTKLTGRSGMPPVWALGHQQSRWSYPDQETVIRIAHEFRTRKIPCDVIVIDIDYMDDYRVFTHSKDRFPDFKDMVRDLENNNFKVVTIIDPGVKKDSKYFVFNDGKKHNYFCTTGDGKMFIGDVWPGQSAFPDFIREDVRLWWAAQHGFHTDLGVAGIWNDMNEPALFQHTHPLPNDATELPPDKEQLFMQEAPEGKVGHFEVRNLYGFQMSRASHEGLLALRPGERPFVLSRSAYAGIQRYAAVWLGDNMSWWHHLGSSIPMLLNMSLSGVPFCGVDIGGFGDDCSAELLVRWYELGIFYPFFRNHCSMYGSPQEPWVFSEDVEKHCRHLIETRYRLLPYLQRLFYEHIKTGAPIMRPLCWHFSDDDFAAEIDDEFMFGEDILVAPILHRGRTVRSVYLPEGKWYSFDGSMVYEGNRLHRMSMQLGKIPAFVRDGSILPLASPMQSTNELPDSPVTFTCYGSNARGMYYEDDGLSLEYQEGAFDLWRLRVDEGRFLAQPVELGYGRSKRQYKLLCQGQEKSVTLSP